MSAKYRLQVPLIVTVICFMSITTEGYVWTRSVSLSPCRRYVPYGFVMRMSITHTIKHYAMPVFADQDSSLDPVFVFYDKPHPKDPSKVGNCPFYRPGDDPNYRFGPGREQNCYRGKAHWGLDVHSAEGTPIIAMDDGIVKYAGYYERYKSWGKADYYYSVCFRYKTFDGNWELFSMDFRIYSGEMREPPPSSPKADYGNVVLAYYPYHNVTIQYSHLQDILPVNRFYQDIDKPTKYVPMPVYARETIGNLGHSGYDGSDSDRHHVDIMIYNGEYNISTVPGSGARTSGVNGTTQDPYPWLYYKSTKGTIYFVSKVQEKDYYGNDIGDTVVYIDTIRVGNMEPFSPIPERQSGRMANGYSTIYWFDGNAPEYPPFPGYFYLFSPVGYHGLEAFLYGYRYDPYLSSRCGWNVTPPLSKYMTPFQTLAQTNRDFVIIPNPFNSSCRMFLSATTASLEEDRSKEDTQLEDIHQIEVYDMSGRKVSNVNITYNSKAGSSYTIDWDGTDNAGRRLPSGTYLVRAIFSDCQKSARVVILR